MLNHSWTCRTSLVKAQLAANCMRIGSLGLAGLHLPGFFLSQKQPGRNIAEKYAGARGFGNAKNVIMIFLQGGPSHIDIWDPKPDAPAEIRGEFKPHQDENPRHAHRRAHADDGADAWTR